MKASLFMAIIPLAAMSATDITVDSVVQRWPWNNKVDITYTVTGGQDLTSVTPQYKRIVFATVLNGTTYTIDGTTDVGASANEGTHTVTWTLPSGVKSNDCTMTAAVYAADAPSGDDYMIIDLTKLSDNVTYEGLLATQDASNERYNTATYKKDKLVLRKVPAGVPYPTGDSVNFGSGGDANTARTWNTTRDYYIGVFPVTQYQYKKLCGSYSAAIASGDLLPVENVSWVGLRTDIAPEASIPTVESNSGTFLQRLNYITGNKFGFDLPTEVMFEIAGRAGATTTFFWGNDPDASYVVNGESAPVAVGSCKSNAWGIFDIIGNVFYWCRDAYDGGSNLNVPDAFTPHSIITGGNSNFRRFRAGAVWSHNILSEPLRFAMSKRNGSAGTDAWARGFRVAMIVF